jgi:dolichyl-phosphate beta-glucosyltransferase
LSPPFLSVVVPTYNEAAGIAGCVAALRQALPALAPSWEIVVADDGSHDGTADVVDGIAGDDPRVRVLRLPHAGKGAAVRQGLLDAHGTWRFMADADLSTPPEEIARFLAVASPGGVEIVIGSREARDGGVRLREPVSRYVIGRVFNLLARAIAVPGIRDTQCGFKLFSARAVNTVCPHLRIDGFAFDVELLFLARRAGLAVRPVGVTWQCRQNSRVAVRRGASAFLDVVRVRLRASRGEYAAMTAQAVTNSRS